MLEVYKKDYSLGKKISQNTKIIALICQNTCTSHWMPTLIANRLLNVKLH